MKNPVKIFTGILVVVMAVSGAGCGAKKTGYNYDGKAQIKEYSAEEYSDLIASLRGKKSVGEAGMNTYKVGDYSLISWSDFTFLQSGDAVSKELFEEKYNFYCTLISDNYYEGKMECKFSDNQGYMIYDLTSTRKATDDLVFPDEDVSALLSLSSDIGTVPLYGAFFYSGGMFLTVELYNKESLTYEKVNTVLDALGYPCPSSL